MCYRTGKYTVCRRVCASFTPDILQAGEVNGLNTKYINSTGGTSSDIKTTQSRKENKGEKCQLIQYRNNNMLFSFESIQGIRKIVCACVYVCVHFLFCFVCVCVSFFYV